MRPLINDGCMRDNCIAGDWYESCESEHCIGPCQPTNEKCDNPVHVKEEVTEEKEDGARD